MDDRPRDLLSLVQRLFLLLVMGSYVVAALWPGFGVYARQVTLARLQVLDGTMRLTLPMALLALLLFNAGLGVDVQELTAVIRRPVMLFTALLVNLLVPLLFLAVLVPVFSFWHNADEIQNLVLGLALVASMPIAGSSTAWSQNANGNMGLSLGLVILSTILSPITTPFTLTVFGETATGNSAVILARLSGTTTELFLALCVVLPSVGGMVGRAALGAERAARLKAGLKLANAAILLVLCYTNASTGLPHMVAERDWDFLIVILATVGALCLCMFTAGWLLGRVLRVDEGQQRSLMYGLGMNNNGTGMVLACAVLADRPSAVLPILAYNLVQHLVAGSVNWAFRARMRPVVGMPAESA